MMDYGYYRDIFGGKIVAEAEFDALWQAARDLLETVCGRELDLKDPRLARAVAYQTEMLACQGGRDALGGRGVSSGITETIGDYSVGYRVGNGEMNRVQTLGGVPISGMALAILRRIGLMYRGLDGRRKSDE